MDKVFQNDGIMMRWLTNLEVTKLEEQFHIYWLILFELLQIVDMSSLQKLMVIQIIILLKFQEEH